MITISTIHNPFNETVSTVEVKDFVPGSVLSDYLPNLPIREGETLIVAVNGEIVSTPFNEFVVNDDDKIAISLKVEAAGAALAVAGYLTAGAGIGFVAVYGLTYLAVSLAIMYGASYLINALGLIDTPKERDGEGASPTYRWGPVQALENPGNPIPVLIGTHRVAGQIIAQFLSTNSTLGETASNVGPTYQLGWPNTQMKYTKYTPNHATHGAAFTERYNVMVAISEQQLDSITDIRINEQPYHHYNGVTVDTSTGNENGKAFWNFGDITTPNYIDYKLNTPNSSHIFQTQGDYVEEIRLILTAPNGLYRINSKGRMRDRTVEFQIDFRPVAEPAAAWESYLRFAVTARDTSEIRRKIRIGGLQPAKYEVRVTRLTFATPDPLKGTMDWTWTSMDEVINEGLLYPGISRYSVSAVATDQLSGRSPSVTALASKLTVPVYNPNYSQWQNRNALNPAWATYYLLNSIHGIVPSRIIYSEFEDWATYCNEVVEGESRFRVSKYFDTVDTAWNQIQEMARYGRGRVIRRGTKYGVFVDKPESVVSHLFTMGNIVEGTFNMEYLPIKDRANAVEVTYTDPDRDFTRQILSIYTTDYRTGEGVPRKADIQINAAVSRSQAIREAVFLLNSNKYILRTIEFDAFIDSFACIVGDLIYFQHSIPHYDDTLGGRIVSAGNDNGSGNPYVEIDKALTLEIGKAYTIMVRYSDDTIVEKTVLGPTDTETTELVVSGAWATVPQKYDVYSFGETETYKKRYRIISITREQELTRKITCMEYNPAVYTDEGYNVDNPQPPIIIRPQEAVNVHAKEFLTYGSGGDFVPNIQVNWHSSNEVIFNDWGIWLENITTSRFFDEFFEDLDDYNFQPTSGQMRKRLVGTTKENNFIISSGEISIGQEYRITVNPIDRPNAETSSNQTIIQVWGKYAPPSDVVEFTAVWDVLKRIVIFTWSEIPDIDLSHYEIRQGDNWDTGVRIVREAKDRSAVYFVEEGTVQERTYMIKAIDTTENYSLNPAITTVYIDTVSSDVPTPENLQGTTESVVTPDGSNRTFVILTWDANAETSDRFSHYEILMEYVYTGRRSILTTFENNYTLEVLPNTELLFAVRAVDRMANRTDYSNVIEITSAKDDVPPAIPEWGSPSIVAGFKVLGLRFLDPPDADFSHMVVERSHNGNFTWEHVTVGSYTGTFLTDMDLEVNVQYWYRAKAVDTSGNESEWSTIESATTLQVGQGDIAYNSILAQHIDVMNLTALSAKVHGTLSAGMLQSNNWGANSGVRIDLDHGTLIMGGHNSPRLHFDGTTLTVPYLSAMSANLGSVYAGLMRSQSWGQNQGFELHLNNEQIRMGGWGNPFFDLDTSGLHYDSPNLQISKNGDAHFAGTLAAELVKTNNIEINALTNHATAGAAETNIVTTTTQTYFDVPGLGVWVLVRAHASLLILYHMNVWNTLDGRSVDTRIIYDTTTPMAVQSRHTSAYAYATGNNTGCAIVVPQLTGTQTAWRLVKVQWKVTEGTGGASSRRLYVYQFLR